MSDTTTPPTTVVTASPAPANNGMTTKTPSVISFAIGVLLFLMPFVDIKCNNASLKKISGVELATGFNVDMDEDDSFLQQSPQADRNLKTNPGRREGNTYALAALILGVVALVLSLIRIRAGATGAFVTGLLSAVALIALYIDINRQIKMDMKMPNMDGATDGFGLGKQMSGMMGISVDFTPIFYLSIIAFAAGAFFSYKRMKAKL
jgi:hypothetical protein